MAPRNCLTLGTGLLVLGLMASCSSVDKYLHPETEIPELDKLGKRADGLRPLSIPVPSNAAENEQLFLMVHQYPGERTDRVIVGIHGVLSDHTAWRYVIGALDGEREFWAIDLPGCGASQKPRATPDGEEYSPTWMARHVMSVLERLLVGRNDVQITLVGHSFGGGVILRMLGDRGLREAYPKVYKRIDGAVLMAPLHFGLKEKSEAFVQLANITDWVATLGAATGVMRRAAAEATYGGSVDPDRVPVEKFTSLYEILLDVERRHAMKYMLRRAVPHDDDEFIDEEQVALLVGDYLNIEQPCLVLWGELDESLKPESGDELVQMIPKSRLLKIEETMHSIPVEEPRLCVDMIERFIDEDIDDWPKEEPPLARYPRKVLPLVAESEALKVDQTESVSRRDEQSVSTAPSTVTVLPGEDVQRSGARYPSDALRMVPGVEVQRLSSTESGVAFRGFRDTSTAAQGVLGLIDGRQVYNQFLGNVLWDQLPVRMEDIERMEIIRGPGSFIHGPNAMHGVVNIVTKSPLDYQPGASVSAIAHVGSYQSRVFGTTVVNRTDFTGTRVTAQWDDIGQFDSTREDTRNKGFAEAAYQVQLDGEEDHVFGVTAGYSQQRFDLLLPRVEEIPSTTAPNDARELFAQANYRLGIADDLDLKAQFSWCGFDADYKPTEYYEPFTLDLDNMDADVQTTWDGDSHSITGGVGYRHATFDTSASDVANGRHSVDLGSIFAQDQFEAITDLDFTLGVRVDSHSVTGTSISPRAAAVWEFVGDNYFRASAGRGFRNPSLRELWFDMQVTGVSGLPPITIAGNNNLDAESLTSFELGYVGAWGREIEVGPEVHDHQFEAGVSVFYNLIDDLIDFQSDPADPTVVLPVNQSDEEVYGFELEGRYLFDDSFSTFANYSQARHLNTETGEEYLGGPVHGANAGLTYSGRDFSLMLWGNYLDSVVKGGVAADEYFLLNGSISYQFPMAIRTRGQAFIRFFNLLDDDHREHPDGDSYGMILTGGLEFSW